MKRTPALTVVLLLMMGRPAAAGLWGEENAPLYKIMWENIEHTLQLRDLLGLAKESTDLARETAGFAQAAVQVTRNVGTIINDPHHYFTYALAAWYEKFPELHGILANAYTVRELLSEVEHPERLPEYDAFAYNRAFDALTMMNRVGFEVMAHAVDVYGVNDPHDRAIEALRTQYDAAQSNLERVAGALNSTGLAPAEASARTAEATAITATAMTQASATIEQIARTMELQYSDQRRKEREGNVVGLFQEAAASRLHLKSWGLDPLKARVARPTTPMYRAEPR